MHVAAMRRYAKHRQGPAARYAMTSRGKLATRKTFVTATSPAWQGRRSARHCYARTRSTLAGLPATTVRGATSLTITEPMPISAPSPMVMPSRIAEFGPM